MLYRKFQKKTTDLGNVNTDISGCKTNKSKFFTKTNFQTSKKKNKQIQKKQ